MRKILITGLVFALSVASLSPAAKAQTRCETLKSDIQAMLGQEYSGKGQAAALESLTAIKRAGADAILTYFAAGIAGHLTARP